MKLIQRLFSAGYALLSFLFVIAALALTGYAALEIWEGVNPWSDTERAVRLNAIIESIGVITIAVAAFELGQTILEEEVIRQTQVSTPTRARRFISRFLVVLVVALAMESLVGVFQFLHTEPERLPQAALVGAVAALLLVAWGVFVHLNRSAEELEPEAMADAKREDDQVEGKA